MNHSDRVATPRNATGRACACRVAGVAVHNAIAADHRTPHIKAVARAAGTNRCRRACTDADRAENCDSKSRNAKTRNEFLHMTPLKLGSDRKPHTRVMRCGLQYTGKWARVQGYFYLCVALLFKTLAGQDVANGSAAIRLKRLVVCSYQVIEHLVATQSNLHIGRELSHSRVMCSLSRTSNRNVDT